ncbi:hypothetical protein FisN_1Lh145 [Fistulifera solaris]|uniref:Uncharacterized protein n=1 Tax=Fistulifera solaris TaxID=1519565 RepID=A0A1Z5K5D9_FISSO|nr:hypothetical protein FisN_1Lh145 [Fistulifera solaris]|eukprot:GAX21311.1 hypothetical protein FisN_1Lh145 [Fistulifera solaris]
MADWCSKISLFSWFSGDSTDGKNPQPSNHATRNHASSERPADVNELKADETTQRTKPSQRRDTPCRSFNKYSKNENTIYFHKASGTNFDAKVVGVHFDDDPENPYYTIQYTARDGEKVERQTTEDRLLPVE